MNPVRCAILAIGWTLSLVSLATAQQAEPPGGHVASKEQRCIFDALSAADIASVATAQFAPTPASETASDTALETAGVACAATYKWDTRLRAMAEQYATSAAVRARLTDALDKALGQDKRAAARTAVDAAWAGLPRTDKVKFSSRRWTSDQAFIGRLRTALSAAGLPQDDAALRPAIGVMWATSLATGAQISWDLLQRRQQTAAANP